MSSQGEIDVQGDRFAAARLIVFRPGRPDHRDGGRREAHVIIVGGAAMDGPRYIWWNFVSSRKERIEEAKADWKAGRFAMVAAMPSSFLCRRAKSDHLNKPGQGDKSVVFATICAPGEAPFAPGLPSGVILGAGCDSY